MNTSAQVTMESKPRVSIVGVNGNVQELAAKVSKALAVNGQLDLAVRMLLEMEQHASSFTAAFAIAHRYVDFC